MWQERTPRRGSVATVFNRLLQCSEVHEHVVLRSPVGFLALHGGIEPGTEGMALTAAAAAGASAYVVTQPRSLGWHVSSHRIVTSEVPRLAEFLDHVEVVISVHGYFRPEQADALFVGGGDRALAGVVARRLRAVVDDLPAIPRSMRGVDPRNPVNRGRGGGVQLELPHRARTDAGGAQPSVAARVTAVLAEFALERAA